MSQEYIVKRAEDWADSLEERDSAAWATAHDSYLIGWTVASITARKALLMQFEDCPMGTLVSYAIAADVLRMEMRKYEDYGWEKK